MNNRFFITILVLIAVFIGAFTFTKQKKEAAAPSVTSTQPTNHVEGAGKSGVVLVEYGDLQCPACAQYYPIVKQVFDKYKDQITFQFRNFPLVQIHPNAFVASRAVEAADKQGKFWEMHDLLYENQEAWGSSKTPTTFFNAYAKQLGLDTAKFQQDMNSQEVNNLINADIAEGKKLGANSTPTFVLDGKKLEPNPRSLEEFNKLIEDAIASKPPKQ
jgi:protein-disulfide isomerase